MASMVRLCFLVALLLITSELMCFARTTPQGKEYEDQDPDRNDSLPLALADQEKTQVISEDDYGEPGANHKHTPPPPPPL
ncbi:uncharacterized protein LOC107616214 isoform X2 [Arachis ipaensis]|uniref:uncharacterized protein LOC107616214 isoform X2 n=1 Tax=Arachis ipaensis TaxID=130454 RepID=UPI0007AEFED7|nr:uncharacterized protein LOC107616214 isoform X2 [Arachis ipaensis]